MRTTSYSSELQRWAGLFLVLASQCSMYSSTGAITGKQEPKQEAWLIYQGSGDCILCAAWVFTPVLEETAFPSMLLPLR